MTFASAVISYDELLDGLGTGRKHILLGNGFSIACDSIFKYERLYDSAVGAGLSKRAQKVFGRLGTSNFEGAMRLLDDAHWVATTYELIKDGRSDLLDDVEIIKTTLVKAVANSHLTHTGEVEEERKQIALEFLSPYHNIFTTNYDLLPYWVNMYTPREQRWGDGFRSDEDEPDAPYVIFTERLGGHKGLFYIHGALHLYVAHGELRKHCWGRTGTPLTQLIKEGLEQQNYPLFIAEGKSEGKLEQIQRNGYLWYCLDKLARIEGALVVFGHALGDSDQHIIDVLATNPKLKRVAIGLFGDPTSKANKSIYASAKKMEATRAHLANTRKGVAPLSIEFFDSKAAAPWG